MPRWFLSFSFIPHAFRNAAWGLGSGLQLQNFCTKPCGGSPLQHCLSSMLPLSLAVSTLLTYLYSAARAAQWWIDEI